jgi:hypothetical protein
VCNEGERHERRGGAASVTPPSAPLGLRWCGLMSFSQQGNSEVYSVIFNALPKPQRGGGWCHGRRASAASVPKISCTPNLQSGALCSSLPTHPTLCLLPVFNQYSGQGGGGHGQRSDGAGGSSGLTHGGEERCTLRRVLTPVDVRLAGDPMDCNEGGA